MVKRFPVATDHGVATAGIYRLEQNVVDVAEITRIQAGDKTAYGPLWNRYWPWLCGYFRSQLGNHEESEDLAGATMLAAFEQLNRFRGQGRGLSDARAEHPAGGNPEPISEACTFKTYLGAIARNKLAHFLQNRTTRRCRTFTEMRADGQDDDYEPTLDALVGVDIEANPLSLLLQYERMDEVCCALAYVGLRSNEQFKALVFHYVCGLAHKEIAEILNIRDETVNTRLQEGRRKLTRYYQALSDETASAVC